MTEKLQDIDWQDLKAGHWRQARQRLAQLEGAAEELKAARIALASWSEMVGGVVQGMWRENEVVPDTYMIDDVQVDASELVAEILRRQARGSAAPHRFQVPIGDWSGDGHGQCDWGTVQSAQPVETWREAYLQSQARWPELAPDGELSRLGMEEWPLERIEELCGDLLEEDALIADDYDQESQGMVLYVLAFCRLSDPSLSGELVDPMPMLPFYGRDDQSRHIGHIGYELLMP